MGPPSLFFGGNKSREKFQNKCNTAAPCLNDPVVSADCIPQLVDLVRGGTNDEKERAAAALWKLARDVYANQVLIAAADGIPPLVALMRDGTNNQKLNAAGALQSLSHGTGNSHFLELPMQNRVHIVTAGGIPPLVVLMRGTEEQSLYAMDILGDLALDGENNCYAIAAADGIPPLVALVRDGTEKQKYGAPRVLHILAEDDKASQEAIAAANGIPPLVALVRDGTEKQKYGAAGALYEIGNKNNANSKAIEAAGGIPPLVALVRDGVEYGAKVLRNIELASNGSIKIRLLIDAALDYLNCDVWKDAFPRVDEIIDTMQEYGIYYDFLVRKKSDFESKCAQPTSPETLTCMLHNFKILGAAATARSNPSALAAKTLFKLLTIDMENAMTSGAWTTSKALLSKTLTLIKYVGVLGGAIFKSQMNPGTKRLWGAMYTIKSWLMGEEMDTPEFRAMLDTNDEYNDKALATYLRTLGLDEFQIEQAQRFERWLAITGVIACNFNAAAEDGNAEAKDVMDLAEAFVMRLTAPRDTYSAPPLLFEIEVCQYANAKRSYTEMLSKEQTIEDGATNKDADDVLGRGVATRLKRQRTDAVAISASLADFFGHEQVARLQLRADDFHPLLVARANSRACPTSTFHPEEGWMSCARLAEGGHLEELKWAHEEHAPWNEWTCTMAAAGGHLEVLKWAHDNGCPWDGNTCASAARGGHLEVLEWAHDNGCPWDKRTCERAAEGGHLDVLEWAHDNGCPWDESTCERAAEGGHLAVLQWAYDNGCPYDE